MISKLKDLDSGLPYWLMSETQYAALSVLEIVVGICQFKAFEIYPSRESRKCHTRADPVKVRNATHERYDLH